MANVNDRSKARSFLICLALNLVPSTSTAKTPVDFGGVVDLDDSTFDKVVSAFQYSLVVFAGGARVSMMDADGPGFKEDSFFALADTFSNIRGLLFARVDVSRNPRLSKRFGVSEATGLPEIVFLKTTDYKEWSDGDVIKKARVDETRYGRSSTSVDQLRQFLKAKTKLPLTLPGCLPKFDVFADRFLEASGDLGRQKVIAARTEEATETCCTKSPSKRKRAERYLKLMQGALEANDQPKYFNSEIERLNKLTKSAKLKDKKKEELLTNLNVVKSFLHPNVGVKSKRDEL